MCRILFYINTLGGGGAERVISELANRFAADQYEVLLAASFPVQTEYPLSNQVQKVYLENEPKEQSQITRNISRIHKLRKLCKEFKPDVAIAFMQEPNFRIILATIGLPIKTIVSVRNDPRREYAGKKGRFVGKCILPMADGCVFQTEQAKAWFPKRLQKRSAVIMNAVANSFFEVRRHAPENIITVGRLSKQKNHEMLIRSFSRIAHKHPEQKLLIYGKGDQENVLQHLILQLRLEEKVCLMGPTTQVPMALSKAGAFVLSSDFEGMPNALLEAMAAGVPSISTDCPCGGPAMLIRHEHNGLLVPVGDEALMANAMDRVLSNAEFAEKLGNTANKDAEKYRPERVFEMWKRYVETVLSRA